MKWILSIIIALCCTAEAGQRISRPPVWPTDIAPPAILSMTVNTLGNDVAVVLTEPVTAGADGFTNSWTLYYNDNLDGETPLATLTYLSGAGTSTLHFTPSTTIPSNAHLLVSIGPITRGEFVQPGSGIKDNAGNLLPTNSSITVTNNSAQ